VEVSHGEDLEGQDRATEAVRFGLAIQREGYNLFAMGPPTVAASLLTDRLSGVSAADTYRTV